MYWLLSFVVFLTLSSVCNGSKHDIYKGHKVFAVSLENDDQLRSYGEMVERLYLDELREGAVKVREALVLTTPEQEPELTEELNRMGLTYNVHIADVASFLDRQDKEIAEKNKLRTARNLPFNEYPRYDEVNAYMAQLAADYPTLVTMVTAGQSYEGRNVNYLLVSTTNFTDASKPIYFLDAMIHAREWVTTPVTLYTLHRLLVERTAEDAELLENIDWIVMPIVNPDGYEYTHTDERLWRRTRSINLNVSTTCVGVDANRNFDVNWNTLGVSSNPCSNTYPGAEAFSEVETRLVRDLMFQYIDRLSFYLNIHSHGNYILYGHGNGTVQANGNRIHHMAALMGAHIDALKLPQAPYYLVGNSALILYSTSGSAQDYGTIIGIPFSYTLELPGYGYLFQVPYEMQDHINIETYEGIAATGRLLITYSRAGAV